jgi:hypothetical protein
MGPEPTKVSFIFMTRELEIEVRKLGFGFGWGWEPINCAGAGIHRI